MTSIPSIFMRWLIWPALFLSVVSPREAQAKRKHGEKCSVFYPCGSGLSCHPGVHRCYHKPRRSGEPCSLGYSCGGGLSCQPGVHKCYHNPRQEGEPCVAGYGCAAGLTCEAGAHVCRRAGDIGDRCHSTRPCKSGLSCQPGVHRCFKNPREEGDPCVAGHPCGPNLFCASMDHVCKRYMRLGDPCDLRGGFTCASGLTCKNQNVRGATNYRCVESASGTQTAQPTDATWKFSKESAAYLPGGDTLRMNGTVEECAATCLAKSWCNSFDYDRNAKFCFLSDQGGVGWPYEFSLKRYESGKTMDYYERSSLDDLRHTRRVLYSHHKKYVIGESNGSANADESCVGSREEWYVVTLDDGKVALRNAKSKKYLVAEPDGSANANRDNIGAWEKWTKTDHSDGTSSFRSHHGKYLVAEADGKLNANRDAIGPWEKFRLQELKDSKKCFR